MNSLATFVLLAACATLVVSQNQQRCVNRIDPCKTAAQQYAESAQDISSFMQSGSFRQHCNKFQSIMTRLKTAIDSSDCRGLLPQLYRDILQKMDSLVNFVCVEKFTAFERNAQCFLDRLGTDLGNRPGSCNLDQRLLLPCNIRGFSTCVTTAVDRTRTCSAEAKQLFTELMAKAVRIIPGC